MHLKNADGAFQFSQLNNHVGMMCMGKHAIDSQRLFAKLLPAAHPSTNIRQSIARSACYCVICQRVRMERRLHAFRELLLRRLRRARTLASQNQSAALAFGRLGVNLIVAQYQWCARCCLCVCANSKYR
jgi:hypothetical protein